MIRIANAICNSNFHHECGKIYPKVLRMRVSQHILSVCDKRVQEKKDLSICLGSS